MDAIGLFVCIILVPWIAWLMDFVLESLSLTAIVDIIHLVHFSILMINAYRELSPNYRPDTRIVTSKIRASHSC